MPELELAGLAIEGAHPLLHRAVEIERERNQLARDLLAIADVAGMPDSYWRTDSRMKRARAALGIDEDADRDPSLYEIGDGDVVEG